MPVPLLQDGRLACVIGEEAVFDISVGVDCAIGRHAFEKFVPDVQFTAETITSDRRSLSEVHVPDQQGGSGRWSLDHLFIDRDSMPTLDYAASGSRYWPPDLLRSTWQYSLSEGQDPDQVIQEFAGLNAEEFWDKVAANLQDDRVRMLFVADSIPTELQTIIEYLNEQTDNPFLPFDPGNVSPRAQFVQRLAPHLVPKRSVRIQAISRIRRPRTPSKSERLRVNRLNLCSTAVAAINASGSRIP
ncbi:MAG TPA: hypothetical protein VEB69_09240, partial [Acidimicrobiia bacterium]|nr:hypothetical protein [Acidimicrobiia bacterium]